MRKNFQVFLTPFGRSLVASTDADAAKEVLGLTATAPEDFAGVPENGNLLFVLIGQSNVQRADAALTVGDYQQFNGVWQAGSASPTSFTTSSMDASAAIMERFGNSDNTKNLRVRTIVRNLGGVGFESGTGPWAPGKSLRTQLFNSDIPSFVDSALGQTPYYPVVVWIAGEEDAEELADSQSYERYLRGLYLELQLRCPGIKLLIPKLISTAAGIQGNSSPTSIANINAAVDAVAADHADVIALDTSSLQLLPDNLHYSIAGYRTFADLVFEALRTSTFEKSNPFAAYGAVPLPEGLAGATPTITIRTLANPSTSILGFGPDSAPGPNDETYFSTIGLLTSNRTDFSFTAQQSLPDAYWGRQAPGDGLFWGVRHTNDDVFEITSPLGRLWPPTNAGSNSGSYQAETTTFIGRLTEAYSQAELDAINAFVSSLKTSGVFGRLDFLMLGIMRSLDDSCINLISNNYDATIVGSMGFRPGFGWGGPDDSANFLDNYLQTGFAPETGPNTPTGNWTDADAGMGAIYETIGTQRAPFGLGYPAYTNDDRVYFTPDPGGGSGEYALNSTTDSNFSGFTTGHWHIDRLSTTVRLYRESALVTSATQTITSQTQDSTPEGNHVSLLAMTPHGAGYEIGLFYGGMSLSTAQQTALRNAYNSLRMAMQKAMADASDAPARVLPENGGGTSGSVQLDTTLQAIADTTSVGFIKRLANGLVSLINPSTWAETFIQAVDAAAARTQLGFTSTGSAIATAADPAAARTAIGLGTMATQNANTVAITGGTGAFTGAISTTDTTESTSTTTGSIRGAGAGFTGNLNVGGTINGLSTKLGTGNSFLIGLPGLGESYWGIDNFGIGTAPLHSLTSGNNNAAIGKLPLYSLQSGNNNLAIGRQPLFSLPGGSNNLAIGNLAGTALLAGNNTVMIGSLTGQTSTSLFESVLIGNSAGKNFNGSGVVFIGNRAGETATRSSTLYISNSQVETPLIYGEFDTNNLALMGAPKSFGGGAGVLNLPVATTVPTSNPTSGFLVYQKPTGEVCVRDQSGEKAVTGANAGAFTGPISTTDTTESTSTTTGSIRGAGAGFTGNVSIGGSATISGLVGIGTTNPSFDLHLVRQINPSFVVQNLSSVQFSGAGFGLRGPATLGNAAETRFFHGNSNSGATASFFSIAAYNAAGAFSLSLLNYLYASHTWEMYSNGTRVFQLSTLGFAPIIRSFASHAEAAASTLPQDGLYRITGSQLLYSKASTAGVVVHFFDGSTLAPNANGDLVFTSKNNNSTTMALA